MKSETILVGCLEPLNLDDLFEAGLYVINGYMWRETFGLNTVNPPLHIDRVCPRLDHGQGRVS